MSKEEIEIHSNEKEFGPDHNAHFKSGAIWAKNRSDEFWKQRCLEIAEKVWDDAELWHIKGISKEEYLIKLREELKSNSPEFGGIKTENSGSCQIRDEGYYWLKYVDGERTIGEWKRDSSFNSGGYWKILGLIKTYQDRHFGSIGSKIKNP